MPSALGRPALALLAAGLVALFAWTARPALDAPFLADDFILLAWSQPSDLAEVKRFFSTDWGGGQGRGEYYRPLVNLSLGLDRWLHANSPRGYHLTNLALHGCATLAFAWLARRFLSTAATLFASGLFLLHPLHDLSVFWLSGRTDLLCAIFYFGALTLALGRLSPARWLGGFAFGIALLAKEMAVTLPLVVALHALVFGPGASTAQRLKTAARAVAPFLIVLAAYLAVRVPILGGVGGDRAFFAVGSHTVSGATRLLLWSLVPWDLGRFEGALTSPGVIVVLALLSLALVVRHRSAVSSQPVLVFATGWIGLAILPVLSQPASWYVYIPSAGACLLLAEAIRLLRWRRLAVTAAVALTLAFAVSLRCNAFKVAESAVLVARLLDELGSLEGTHYLVNAPVCLAGRFPLLTSESQYDLALRRRGGAARVRPLSYAYVGRTETFVPLVTTQGGAVETAVFGDDDTFLTLRDLASAPQTPVEGVRFAGSHATYTVHAMAEDGKTRALRITEIACDAEVGLLEYRPDRLRSLRWSCEVNPGPAKPDRTFDRAVPLRQGR